MPLTDEEERELRIELMTTQIEQSYRLNIDKMRLEMKMENRKFMVSAEQRLSLPPAPLAWLSWAASGVFHALTAADQLAQIAGRPHP